MIEFQGIQEEWVFNVDYDFCDLFIKYCFRGSYRKYGFEIYIIRNQVF